MLLYLCPTSTNTMPNKTEKNVTKWSRNDEAMLVHTLAEQKATGNWGDNNPKMLAWTACMIALTGSEKASGGTPKTLQAIKSRWQCIYSTTLLTAPAFSHTFKLKQEFNNVKKLHGLSGFG